jgi:DNA-binding CsgD family transcriptional regulator
LNAADLSSHKRRLLQPPGETTIWLQANIAFNRAVRERARQLVHDLGAVEAYREARRLRLATEPGDARLFAYNVELVVAESAGLSPLAPGTGRPRVEAQTWALPFLSQRRANALQVALGRVLSRFLGAPAPTTLTGTFAPAPAPAPAAPPDDGEPAAESAPDLPTPPSLTARQIECLRWTARGKSSWDISQILGISPRTVDEHLDNACRRLGVKRRSQAAVEAAKAGLL